MPKYVSSLIHNYKIEMNHWVNDLSRSTWGSGYIVCIQQGRSEVLVPSRQISFGYQVVYTGIEEHCDGRLLTW